MIVDSWTFFFALGYVLALVWVALELYRAGYRKGQRDALLIKERLLDEDS